LQIAIFFLPDSADVGRGRKVEMTVSGMALPANPNITQLKKQAKDLQHGVRAMESGALDRVAAFHPAGREAISTEFSLRDAQVTLARQYGFDGWHQLNTAVGERMVEERDLHRWFGVQLNNGMWTAIEDDTIGPHTDQLERERLLYSAYASAYHWRHAGTMANVARGEHLISRMAARLGEADLALRHARRCLMLIEEHRGEMEDWDEPFAHEALARAHAAVGDAATARSHLDLAIELTGVVADGGDRAVLEAELRRGPWFGLR
jgi:hypothetical protein